MTAAKSTRRLLVQIGDGATPTEAFAASCSINTSREFSFDATTVETTIPDCDNPYAPSWVDRVVDTLSASISGAGTCDTSDFAMWRAWFLSGAVRNCRITISEPLAAGGGRFQGAFVLTKLGGAKEGDKATMSFSCELQSSGAVTWVPAAA